MDSVTAAPMWMRSTGRGGWQEKSGDVAQGRLCGDQRNSCPGGRAGGEGAEEARGFASKTPIRAGQGQEERGGEVKDLFFGRQRQFGGGEGCFAK
jgi:hypothetical protein